MMMAAEQPTQKLLPLRQRPAWAALEAHHQKISGLHLRELFAADAKRGERLTLDAAGIYLDFSKNRITDETLKLLVKLAEESGLRSRIDAMFLGDKINVTEKRAVLHVALRAPKNAAHFSIRFQQCRYDMSARCAARVILPVARISFRKSSITSIDWSSR